MRVRDGVGVAVGEGVIVAVGVAVGVGLVISTGRATSVMVVTAGNGVTVETAPAPVMNATGKGGVGAAAGSEHNTHLLVQDTGY